MFCYNFLDKDIADILNEKDSKIRKLQDQVKKLNEVKKTLQQSIQEEKAKVDEYKRESRNLKKQNNYSKGVKSKGFCIGPQRKFFHKSSSYSRRKKLQTLKVAVQNIFAPGLDALKETPALYNRGNISILFSYIKKKWNPTLLVL